MRGVDKLTLTCHPCWRLEITQSTSRLGRGKYRRDRDKRPCEVLASMELNYWIMKILTSWLNRRFTSRKQSEHEEIFAFLLMPPCLSFQPPPCVQTMPMEFTYTYHQHLTLLRWFFFKEFFSAAFTISSSYAEGWESEHKLAEFSFLPTSLRERVKEFNFVYLMKFLTVYYAGGGTRRRR